MADDNGGSRTHRTHLHLVAEAKPQTKLEPDQTAAEESPHHRGASTLGRDATALIRSEQSARRREMADRRDDTASLRDLIAEERDRAAAARDAAAEEFELAVNIPHDGPGAAREYAAAVRAQAAADRAQAAADREQAAADREQAVRDREAAQLALEHSHLDDLTGAYRGGIGHAALQDEIDRARRSDGRLVLAFVDLDNLKGTNDREGHAAGDVQLRDVVDAIRSKMRSYEPVVRVGGDEFLCALQQVDLEAAKERFDEIRSRLRQMGSSASISVGLAALGADDTLDGLISRSDAALARAKQTKR